MLGTQHHPRRLFSSMPARHRFAPFVSQVVGFQPRGKESEGALEVIRRSVSPYQEAKDDQNPIDPACMRKQEEVPMATQDSPSLYERLGGVYSIATVVDDLIDRVMADLRLNANPLVDEAHHKVPPAGFKYLVTEMLCWAAGGPQKYSGKDMESSHRDLRITPGEWDAFMDDVAQTLDKFAVPAAERAEVVAIVESTRGSIVAA